MISPSGCTSPARASGATTRTGRCPESGQQRWHLQPGHGLGTEQPAESPPDAYRYDPAHPTPTLSGPTLVGNSEPEDNRRLEARKDVLTFTSPVLPSGLEIIGPVTADLYVRSSRAHTDFVVRLCDVGPTGASINVCEGVRRLLPGRPGAHARRRRAARAGGTVAGRAPVPAGSPGPGPGRERRLPAGRPQPGHRGAAQRHRYGRRRPGGLPRPGAPVRDRAARPAVTA